MLQPWLDRVVFARAWLTFLVMVLAFVLFGAGTVNLFFVLKANLGLIAEHGMQALADGAARQFFELMITAALSMVAYVLFKACEHKLVHRLCDSKE